jgi:RNA polymerase sigma factor for flagellar operon FliA
MVQRLARQMAAKLPANVELDDLIQVGMIGLSDALARFDASQGVRFETFAHTRINGAMLDELRASDWMSRGCRRDDRRIDAAARALEQRLGRQPREGEVAHEMGLSLQDYRELLGKVRGAQLVYLEGMSGDDSEEDFLGRDVADEGADLADRLHDQRMRQALARAADALPERERQVMGMYYETGLTLKEIGAVLGVTETRAWQLHRQAVARLRVGLSGW